MKRDETDNLSNVEGSYLLREVINDLKRDIFYDLLYATADETATIMARVDLLTFLADRYFPYPPLSREVCQQWRTKMLDLWDSQGGGGWLDERREVIVETFGKLEAIIRRYDKTSTSSAQDVSTSE